MNFSDYIVYVDESGDHSLTSIDANYPLFVLAFCVFRKEDYVNVVSPALQTFKFKWFGVDTIVLHEHEIRRKMPPFSFLQNSKRYAAFMDELSDIFSQMPMVVLPSVIRKDLLKLQYYSAENPYHLSLLFCMERLKDYLGKNGQAGMTTHIVFEQRGGKEKGGKEDKELELEFFRIKAGRHYLCRGATFPDLDFQIVSKKINSAGLQVADLVARPIGLNTLRPNQANRAFDAIQPKLIQPRTGYIDHGIKVFP